MSDGVQFAHGTRQKYIEQPRTQTQRLAGGGALAEGSRVAQTGTATGDSQVGEESQKVKGPTAVVSSSLGLKAAALGAQRKEQRRCHYRLSTRKMQA
jgi:hypothetical protein